MDAVRANSVMVFKYFGCVIHQLKMLKIKCLWRFSAVQVMVVQRVEGCGLPQVLLKKFRLSSEKFSGLLRVFLVREEKPEEGQLPTSILVLVNCTLL